jgi:hypothetical protein
MTARRVRALRRTRTHIGDVVLEYLALAIMAAVETALEDAGGEASHGADGE